MPELYTDGAISDDEGPITDYESSAAANFGAGFQRQWDTNPVAFVGREARFFADRMTALGGGDVDMVDQKTAQEENKRLGLDLEVGAGGMPRHELDALQYLKQREIGQSTVSARPHGVGATLAGFAGGFAAGATDPINIASAFIPVVQEARYEAWLAQAGESFVARAAVRAKAGAIEGLVGAAVVEPIVYTGAQQEQLDYGLTDSFVNVMFGGVLGGGLHVPGGAAYDWRIRRALTQLDVGLRAAYADVPDRVQLAALHQATEALENAAPVQANTVLAQGLKPAQREALAALPANEPAAAPPTREIPQAAGLAFDVKPVKEGVAVTPAGRKVPVLYAIADLDSLVTSHTKDLGENPAYPQELQPRDRARAQSEAQISNMAARLNPELLGEEPGAGGGAPIVDKTGIVESGNGRLIALQRIVEGNPEKWREYQDFLKTQGYDTAGIAKPVLVRVRTGDLAPAERVAFTREANAPTVSGMSAAEQARADAKALPDDILALHQGGDFRAAGNGKFSAAAISALAPSQGERANFFRPDGSLSDEGAKRLERALLARAFGDDAGLITALTEASEESGIKAIGGALVDVSPLWARMRADAANDRIEPSVDSTKNLLDAIRTIREARAGGKNLLDMVNQVDLLAGDLDPKTVTWVRMMFRNANLTGPLGRDKLAALFQFYADEARKQTAGPNLLGEKSATPEQILAAKREQDRRRGKQLDLLGGQPDRGPSLFEPAQTARGDVPEPRAGEASPAVEPDRRRDVGSILGATRAHAADMARAEGREPEAHRDITATGGRSERSIGGQMLKTTEIPGQRGKDGPKKVFTAEFLDHIEKRAGVEAVYIRNVTDAAVVERLEEHGYRLDPGAPKDEPSYFKRVDLVPESAFKDVGRKFTETQSGWSIDRIFEAAEKNQPALDQMGRDVAGEIEGAKWHEAPKKTKERFAAKIEEKGVEPGAITDVVRGTISTPTPDGADRAVAALTKRATILDEDWRRYPGGYVDRKLNVRFDDGQVGEIIVASEHMIEVKNEAHLLLDRSRGMKDGARNRQRAIDLAEQQEKFFGPAVKKDDGPWEKVYAARASEVGKGGVSPKVFEKPALVKTAPDLAADTKASSSMGVQDEAPSLRTNALTSSPTATKAAGVPSQLSQVTDMFGGPSAENVAKGQADVNDRWAAEDAQIAAKAEQDVAVGKDATIEDLAADAAFYDAHLASMRERGLLSDVDEADILAAEQVAVDLEQRAMAYEAAGACEMEG